MERMIDPISIPLVPVADRDEARFWGERQTPEVPDHRLRVRAPSPQELWEDPEVEAIARGRYVDRILAACDGPRPLDILELACGCGWLSLELARLGHRVRGLDLSPARVQSARDYGEEVRAREPELGPLEHETADLNTVALPQASYDRIVCWDGLHHVAAIDSLLSRAHDALRPGGRLLVFDHIGPASRLQEALDRSIAAGVLVLSQPRSVPALLRNRRYHRRAPSEDVTGFAMIGAAARAFGSDNVRWESALAFGKRWLARLRGPRGLRLAVLRAICAVDRGAIRLKLARGEYVYFEAVRRAPMLRSAAKPGTAAAREPSSSKPPATMGKESLL